MIMLLVLGIACFGGAIFLAGEALAAPRREVREALARAVRPAAVQPVVPDLPVVEVTQRTRRHPVHRAAAIALRLSPRTTTDAVALRLARAGLASRLGAHDFLALRLAIGAGGAVLGMTLGIATGSVPEAMLLVAALGGFAFYAPELWLRARLRARREAIRRALPDALDLLTVSVEAGLGLDAAIGRLTTSSEGPLVDELTMLLGQMSVGESRADALKRLAERVDVPEVASFARAVAQANQLGVSLGKTLRLQASEVRLRRQAIAEERAAKTPVKMLFPTTLCIFPTLFIVLLAPPLMTLIHGL